MVDCRTMLSALVAGYDQHRRWMMADKFAALQRAVEHARDVLNEPAAIESWHVPRALSDKALRLITSLPMDEIERRLRVPMAADGEAAKLVEAMRELAYDASQHDTFYLLHRAADLLERQAAAAPVARLPEDAQVIEPANRTILVPVPAPIPVSERLPGPEDCLPWPDEPDGTHWCWAFVKGPLDMDSWERRPVSCLTTYRTMHTHWLPAHALPLPEVE